MAWLQELDSNPYQGPGTAGAPPPAAAAAPAPGSVTTDAGYTPDYNALIRADPGYQAGEQGATTAEALARAQRKQQLQSAVIQYGGTPTGFQDAYGDIDAATQAQAGQNANSTLAQLRGNYEKSTRQFRAQLAARGALQSGDLNYGSDQLAQGHSQQQYDAGNIFGNQVQGALGAYSGVLSQNARDRAAAIQNAQGNVLQNPAYRPSAPTTAQYDGVASAQYGTAVYKGADGSLYGSNGQPFQQPIADGATAPDFFAPLAGY